MDTSNLCDIFMKTLDPDNEVRARAEESLKEVSFCGGPYSHENGAGVAWEFYLIF